MTYLRQYIYIGIKSNKLKLNKSVYCFINSNIFVVNAKMHCVWLWKWYFFILLLLLLIGHIQIIWVFVDLVVQKWMKIIESKWVWAIVATSEPLNVDQPFGNVLFLRLVHLQGAEIYLEVIEITFKYHVWSGSSSDLPFGNREIDDRLRIYIDILLVRFIIVGLSSFVILGDFICPNSWLACWKWYIISTDTHFTYLLFECCYS